MQVNPEYSVFSLQTVGLYCILVGLSRKLGIFAKTNPKSWEIVGKCLQTQSNFPKTREILAKHRQIQSNFLKTRGIWGKMSNILAKWLHYLWLFPNIQGILFNLLHLHGDFSENSGNSCQNTHTNVIFFYP